MNFIDIAEIAEKSGAKPSALRYYEQIGLISSASRHGLRRQYTRQTLLKVRLIRLGQAAGFSLEEIKDMFRDNETLNISRDTLRDKIAKIERQIQDLTTLRNTLHHVILCPAPSHLECPTFQKLLNIVCRSKHKSKKY